MTNLPSLLCTCVFKPMPCMILQTKAMMRALKTTIQMEITMETVAQMELTSLHVLAGS